MKFVMHLLLLRNHFLLNICNAFLLFLKKSYFLRNILIFSIVIVDR
jgi:hypothetical protein